MLELAVDMAALFDRHIFIGDVAANASGRGDGKIAGVDRSFDRPRQAGILGNDRALDLARGALDQRQAFHVANHFTVDMQVDLGFDIAGDDDAVTDDGKARAAGAAASSHGWCLAGCGLVLWHVVVRWL